MNESWMKIPNEAIFFTKSEVIFVHLLKTLTILSDKTVRRSAVDKNQIKL